MSARYDAIIVGAGPAGSTTAILLALHGWHVALIEKVGFPRRKVCGECIAASNLPLLDALGIGQQARGRAGAPLRQVGLAYKNHMVCAELPFFNDPQCPWGYALGRENLDTLLLERAKGAGVTLFCPWTAHSISGEPGDMSCKIQKPHSQETQALAASVMIAAYGSWEAHHATANMAGSTKGQETTQDHNTRRGRQRASDLFAFKANFKPASLQSGLLPVLSFPGGYGGMVIAGASVMTLAFCMRRDTLAACRQAKLGHKAAEAAVAYVMDTCLEANLMLQGSERLGPWLAAGPIRPGIRLPQKDGTLFLVGNAAGEAHPIIGEGISMAIQGAWLLADTLLAHSSETLKSKDQQAVIRKQYARAWQHAFMPRIRLAALFAHVAMRPALMGILFPVLRRFPWLLTRAAVWGGKIDCAPVGKLGLVTASNDNL